MTAPTLKQPKLLKLHFNDSLSQVSKEAYESSDESCQDSDDSEYQVRLNPMQRKARKQERPRSSSSSDMDDSEFMRLRE